MIDVSAAAVHLRSELRIAPRWGIVLGSGLGGLVDRVEDPVSIPFDAVPGLPAAGVHGHAGTFVGGRLGGAPVLLQAGRFHLYEGHDLQVVVAPVRIMAALGVEVLVVTNAVGGIRSDTAPGDLVLIDDHLNMMFRSPLTGPVGEGEQRFPDMSAPYDAELQETARRAAIREGVELCRGTYAAVLGPQFETAAEIRMLARMGADVVGMSTVPEVITARALGVRCVGFSMVTNEATGRSVQKIDHDDVLAIGADAGRRLGRVLVSMVSAVEAAPGHSVSAK